MPDLLSQDEIDALLSAVEKVAEPAAEAEQEAGEEPVTPYDFSHPQRLSREQIRMLRNMHEVAIRNMAASLSAYLRGPLECRLISVDQMTYTEFITGLPNPTCLNIIRVTPNNASMVIEMNPSIAFPLIDRLLGASRPAGPLDRPLTSIEFRLISRVMDVIRTQIELVWRRSADIRMERFGQETNPHLMALAPPTEMIVGIIIEMHLADHSGLVNICVPFTPFQSLLARFFSVAGYSYDPGNRDEARRKLIRALSRIPVEVTVAAARTTAAAETLGAMKEGSILVTERHAKEPCVILVENISKFIGREGIHRHRKAVRIEGLARKDADA
jgi:flagellar motor switch protein FliM